MLYIEAIANDGSHGVGSAAYVILSRTPLTESRHKSTRHLHFYSFTTHRPLTDVLTLTLSRENVLQRRRRHHWARQFVTSYGRCGGSTFFTDAVGHTFRANNNSVGYNKNVWFCTAPDTFFRTSPMH